MGLIHHAPGHRDPRRLTSQLPGPERAGAIHLTLGRNFKRNVIEVDETYVGGKARSAHRERISDKAVIIGAVQRGGPIRLKMIPAAKKKYLRQFISDVTDPKGPIHTD